MRRRKTGDDLKTDTGSRFSETKATTTPLVNHFFQSLFSDQMSKSFDEGSFHYPIVEASDDEEVSHYLLK